MSSVPISEPIVQHLSQSELAARWSIQESTLERWRSAGIGPIYLKLPGRVLYRISDVEAYERDSLRKSTSQTLRKTTGASSGCMSVQGGAV
jgi:hypothetical protein